VANQVTRQARIPTTAVPEATTHHPHSIQKAALAPGPRRQSLMEQRRLALPWIHMALSAMTSATLTIHGISHIEKTAGVAPTARFNWN